VSVLQEGVRYGLFLCDTKSEVQTSSCSTELSTEILATQHCEQLRYLVDAALQNLDMYSRAIPFILATPDDELYRLQGEYKEKLQRYNHTRMSEVMECGASLLQSPPLSTLANEVFWHVHTLFPKRFSDAPTGDDSDIGSLDLVAACRKNVNFMQQLLVDVRTSAGRGLDDIKALLERALREYVNFLMSLREQSKRGHENRTPVPSLIVDHMWHSHMAFPERYTADCLRLCGRLIDHVVEEDDEE
jgi:hypothetical protein